MIRQRNKLRSKTHGNFMKRPYTTWVSPTLGFNCDGLVSDIRNLFDGSGMRTLSNCENPKGKTVPNYFFGAFKGGMMSNEKNS